MTMALDMSNGGAEITVDDPLVEAGLPQVAPDGSGLPDPETDPDKFNALTQAALAENEVEDFAISGPPDGTVTLVAGLVDDLGTRFIGAEVRELRGRDEEALERAFVTGDTVRYLDAIVKAGTVRIGNTTELKTSVLDSLLLGDRDLLIMQIRRSTFGDTMELGLKCPHCDSDFDIRFSFGNDVTIKGWTASEDKNQRLFDVECPSGKTAELRLVDGKAQKAVYTSENVAKKTDAELNTLLLREVVLTYAGQLVKGVGPILDMPAADRRHLLEWLSEHQPGPKYQDVTQECPDCLREFPLVITPRIMFRG